MNTTTWLALTLSLSGIASVGVSTRAVAAPPAGAAVCHDVMPTPTRSRWAPRGGRHTAAGRFRRPQAATVTNLVTGIAVVPGAEDVRLVIEATEPFTPRIALLRNGASTATVIRVPGLLSDTRGVGTASVHKNGVVAVRYANQPNHLVQFVADTEMALDAAATPSADRKHWEIVLTRPAAVATQVAAGGAVAPTRARATVAVHPAAAPARAAKPGTVKPVILALAPAAASLPAAAAPTAAKRPSPPAAPAFVPAFKPTPAPAFKPALVARAAPSLQTPDVGTPTPGEDKRVSLDFVSADINDVIKALALQSGINVVTSNEVKGTITVSLKRVPMIEALDTITRLSGYQYARLNSGYIVGTTASVSALTAIGRAVPIVTEYIRYRYVSRNDLYASLASKFPGLQLPGAGAAGTASDAANPALPKLLVLTDTRDRITQVRAFVEELDREASEPTMTQVTELYRIKTADARDLIRLVSQLVPSVVIQVGAAQSFQSNSTGQSTTFSAGGSFAAPGAGAAGGTPAAGQASGGPGNTTSGATGLSAPNTLVLTGTPADIARARELLGRVDARTSQIYYEARVVDVNRSDRSQLGLTYDFTRQVSVGERNETGQGSVGPVTNATNNPATNLDFGAILRTPYSIGVALNALESNNKARTLSAPNLSALDGQSATAFIGDQVKYVISITQGTTGPTIQTDTATVGVTLKVTGKASPDGYVTLYIHPEVSTITSFLTVGSTGISLPQVSTRYVDTTVRIKSGETIAIGGLISEQDIKNLQKIPIIGDIPFLGKLFRYADKRKTRSEVIIFITARVSEL